MSYTMGSVKKFIIEAKAFDIFLEGGGELFRLIIVERRRGAINSILLGRESSRWILSVIRVLGENRPKNFSFWRFREADKLFTAEKRCNARGSFLAVTEFFGGGRRSSVFIPSGPFGKGWWQFGAVINGFLYPVASTGSSQYGNGRKISVERRRKANAVSQGTSYADVVRQSKSLFEDADEGGVSNLHLKNHISEEWPAFSVQQIAFLESLMCGGCCQKLNVAFQGCKGERTRDPGQSAAGFGKSGFSRNKVNVFQRLGPKQKPNHFVKQKRTWVRKIQQGRHANSSYKGQLLSSRGNPAANVNSKEFPQPSPAARYSDRVEEGSLEGKYGLRGLEGSLLGESGMDQKTGKQPSMGFQKQGKGGSPGMEGSSSEDSNYDEEESLDEEEFGEEKGVLINEELQELLCSNQPNKESPYPEQFYGISQLFEEHMASGDNALKGPLTCCMQDENLLGSATNQTKDLSERGSGSSKQKTSVVNSFVPCSLNNAVIPFQSQPMPFENLNLLTGSPQMRQISSDGILPIPDGAIPNQFVDYNLKENAISFICVGNESDDQDPQALIDAMEVSFVAKSGAKLKVKSFPKCFARRKKGLEKELHNLDSINHEGVEGKRVRKVNP